MIDVQVKPDRADGYVLRVLDGNNANVLLSSTSQSYANADFAERLAKRLFASADVWSKVVGVNPPFEHREPVSLRVVHRSGGSAFDMIRGDNHENLRVEIEPDTAGGYVLRVVTDENGATLLSSTSQSYANPSDPELLAHRLFGFAAYGAEWRAEPVRFTVIHRDGDIRSEMIR